MIIKDLSLLTEFLANPDTSKKTQLLFRQLNEAYKKNPSSATTQGFLNKYISSIGNDISTSCASYVLTDTFDKLSNASKASVIRDIFGPGIKVGYNKSAEISRIIYDGMLKDKKISQRSTLGILDEKRYNTVLKIAIGDALDKNYDAVSNFITGSFAQLVQTGNRNTIIETAASLKSSHVDIVSKRTTTSAKPCGYCAERSGVIVSVNSAKGDDLFHFHDNCHCELEIFVR